jgi:hypothetical protein
VTFQVMAMKRLLMGFLFWLLAFIAGVASASTPHSSATSALAVAERALQAVDFEAVQQAAAAGLATGEATSAETARLNVLAGMAAAVLGKDAASTRYFVVALAIRPDLKMDGSLSPKTRQPYLDAVGFWGDREERLRLTAKVDVRRAQLTIRVSDPAAIAPRYRLNLRAKGDVDYERRTLESQSRVDLPVPTRLFRQGFEYYVELVDAAGNRLLEVGTEDEPIVVPGVRGDRPVLVPNVIAAHSQPSTKPSRAVPIGLLTGGLLVTGVGVYFHVRREDEAARWNGPSCEHAGQTRGGQCGDVDRRRERFEWLSIGSYALGGALTIAGTSWLVFDSSSDGTHGRSERVGARASCGWAGVGMFLACSGAF